MNWQEKPIVYGEDYDLGSRASHDRVSRVPSWRRSSFSVQEKEREKEREKELDKEELTLENLKLFKEVFDKAVDGQLTEADFLAEFGPILGQSKAPEQLRLWFMKIDASANGSVDWDEFSDFLLTSRDGNKKKLNFGDDSQLFTKELRATSTLATECSANPTSGHNHSDIVTKLYVHPRNGKYYTASQDGTVRSWDSHSLEFETILHNTSIWVTDLCPSLDHKKLCVAAVDRTVTLYNVGHNDTFYKGFVGNTTATTSYMVNRNPSMSRQEIDMRNMPLKHSRVETKEAFHLRQERLRLRTSPPPPNEIKILKQMDTPAMCLSSCSSLPKTLLMGLSNGVLQGYELFGSHPSPALSPLINMRILNEKESSWKRGDAMITTLTSVDSSFGVFATGSDGSVCAINLDRGVVNKIGGPEGAPIHHNHPIHSATWIHENRLLATCGTERHISLWSSSSQAPPITLVGHLAPVALLSYTNDKENFLVSMDVEKCLKVWDLRTLRPVQTVVDYDVYAPINRLTAMVFDDSRHALVTASTAPVVWTLSKLLVPYPDPSYSGHQKNVRVVTYNAEFHQIISCDLEAIYVWSAIDGTLMDSLTVDLLRSTIVRPKLENASTDIAACCLDATGRRLLTCVTSGGVLISNFANGRVLKELVPIRAVSVQQEKAIAECFYMKTFGLGVKHYVGCLRGSDLLVWEDAPEATDWARLERVVHVGLSLRSFERLFCAHHGDVVPEVSQWRSPLPLSIVGIPPHNFGIGTDAGLILLYSAAYDLIGFFGSYDVGVSVLAMEYDPEDEVIFSGRSDGKLSCFHVTYKDRWIEGNMKDNRGRIPTIQALTIDRRRKFAAVGDDEGYIYLWSYKTIQFNTLKPFSRSVSALGYPTHQLSCVRVFRAHNAEINMLSLFSERGKYFIASCATDCQVRVWREEGEFVGYCGAPSGWNISEVAAQQTRERTPAVFSELLEETNDLIPIIKPELHRLSPEYMVLAEEECNLGSPLSQPTNSAIPFFSAAPKEEELSTTKNNAKKVDDSAVAVEKRDQRYAGTGSRIVETVAFRPKGLIMPRSQRVHPKPKSKHSKGTFLATDNVEQKELQLPALVVERRDRDAHPLAAPCAKELTLPTLSMSHIPEVPPLRLQRLALMRQMPTTVRDELPLASRIEMWKTNRTTVAGAWTARVASEVSVPEIDEKIFKRHRGRH